MNPAALRDQADRVRFYAHMLSHDEMAADRLRDFAAELDARAAALEP